jgi:predicted Zn-dependent protease
MLDPKDLEAVARRAIDAAKKIAPSAEVRASAWSGSTANIRFALGTVQSCGDVSQDTVNLRVALGKRHAAAYGNQTHDAALAELAQRAVAMAKLAPEDPESMPLLGPQSYGAAVDAYDPSLADVSDEARAATAATAMQVTRKAGLREAGYFETSSGSVVVTDSAGLRAFTRATYGELTMTARTPDATGSGWALAASHRAQEIDAGLVVRAACDKAQRSAHARPLSPGKYTVVLEPAAVGDLLGFLGSPLDARAVDEGRSALTRKGGGSPLGERIASDLVTLRSDPSDPELPVAPFDEDDGLPRKAIDWIENGKLNALSYSRYWAAKQGKQPTSLGGWHLLGGKAGSIEELVAGVKRGLLVTRFWYTRTLDEQLALVTGLTRDGVFLIENGKITTPVNNFRWNESPLTMLKNCDALTRETWRVDHNTRVPALRTHEFNMASLSDAV